MQSPANRQAEAEWLQRQAAAAQAARRRQRGQSDVYEGIVDEAELQFGDVDELAFQAFVDVQAVLEFLEYDSRVETSSPTSGGGPTSCMTSTRSGWRWVTWHVRRGTTRPAYLARAPHSSPSPTRTTSIALCVLCCVGDVACRAEANSLTTTSLMPTTWVGGMRRDPGRHVYT